MAKNGAAHRNKGITNKKRLLTSCNYKLHSVKGNCQSLQRATALALVHYTLVK